MQRNVGRRDSQFRILFGVAFLILAVVLNSIHAAAFISAIIGVALLGSGLTHRCPAYSLFGINTCSSDQHPTPL
jgi:hypothetical protein